MTQPIQIEHWPLDRLHGYARNPRRNDHAVEKMADVIREFSFRIPIIARSSGEIVDGHLRYKAACQLGLDTVPVILADDLTDTQIKAFRLLANRSATWAEWDEELLQLELADLSALDYDLSLTGFDADELAELLADGEPDHQGETDDDEVPESDADIVSRPGDLWVLGEHRVLCGDATDAANYARLLAGTHADMVFTDPPYNVNYSNSAKDKQRKTLRPILNDNLGEGFYDFLLAALTPMVAHCRGALYIAMAGGELDTLQAAFRAAGGHWSTFIIWVKHKFTLGRSDYQRQYEPLLYGWPDASTRHWCGDRDQSDVWNIRRPDRSDLHPTMKPVELVERCIRNSSRPGDGVLDCFGGSGTTLIAAHKSGRRAYLMELDPKYVDTIIRRWQSWSGEQAIRDVDDVPFDALAAATEDAAAS